MTPSEEPVARATYDEVALRYARHAEVSAYNAYYERPALRRLIPPVDGRRVLDAGCAAGSHSEWLVDHGATVVALDVSDRMVELCRQRLGGRAEVVKADLSQPLSPSAVFATGSFDLVVSSLTLHYVQDWSVPLGEFFRVLRPGGVLVVSTHHPYSDRRLAPADDYFKTGLVEDQWSLSDGSPVAVRFYRKTIAEILTGLAVAGFVIERVEEPAPSEELRARYPTDFVELQQQPAFLLIRARKL